VIIRFTILGASLVFTALAAAAEPYVLVERDPITDAVTSTVKVYGSFLPDQRFGKKPSIRVICRITSDMSKWTGQEKNSEAGAYRTVVLVDIPGSGSWDSVASGVVRLDQHDPFPVNTMFLRSFEGFTLDTQLAELAKTATVAVRIADHTIGFEMTGLREAMLQTPNKCGWDSLRVPSADEA
jgi:hypothetical protein